MQRDPFAEKVIDLLKQPLVLSQPNLSMAATKLEEYYGRHNKKLLSPRVRMSVR